LWYALGVDLTAADLGVALGSAAASFLASYVALVRPLAGKVKRVQADPEDIQAIRAVLEEARAELGKFSTRIDRLERDQSLSSQDIDKLQERQGRTVSQEEFATYAQTMQQSLQGLVEKLGHATGTIEAWVRQQPGAR